MLCDANILDYWSSGDVLKKSETPKNHSRTNPIKIKI